MTDKPQVDKFKELARQLYADEDEAAFEGALKKIAQAPKPDDEKKDGAA